jgi:hypothetical protein
VLPKLSISKSRPFISAALCVAALVSTLPLDCAARAAGRRNGRAPRVGTIRDYPATGMMTGCGNAYFHFPRQAASDTNLVFIAPGDGKFAWMNLDGRDTRVSLVRATTWYEKEAGVRWRHDYRAGATHITTVYVMDESDADEPIRMSITVRRGRAARTVRVVGSADC